MPIGEPSHKPDPKSGCSGEEAPMVLTQVEELGCTGSWSMRVFQILSAGRTGHFPMVGVCPFARLANPSNTIATMFFKSDTPVALRIAREGSSYHRVTTR